jgi:hypothetical protein
MSGQRLIHRVAGDLGEPITVTHFGVNVTGWTITARFKKPDNTLYELTATVTAAGDGADIPAEYNFRFGAGDLTPGDHKFDFHYSDAAIDDYSWPAKNKLTMTVRDA